MSSTPEIIRRLIEASQAAAEHVRQLQQALDEAAAIQASAPAAQNPRYRRLTEQRLHTFLQTLAQAATAKEAAKKAGVDLSYLYRLRRHSPRLAAVWTGAEEAARAVLEKRLRLRMAAAANERY